MARGQLRIPRPGDEDEGSPEEEVNEALAFFGLYSPEPLELEETFALWPDCVEIFNFWLHVQTQWRYHPQTGRRTGMDYAGVATCMAMHRIHKNKRSEFFAAVQVMENAAIEAQEQ